MFKEKICISRIDKMGDMILTLPVIKSIKIQNPNSEIHVLASIHNAKVLKNIKYIDEVLLIGSNTNSFIKLSKTKNFTIIQCENGVDFDTLAEVLRPSGIWDNNIWNYNDKNRPEIFTCLMIVLLILVRQD